MEQKNCPDPRNCTDIHYFGRCPYQHQACNRGPSCLYVKQNNCQFYHPEEDYPQYKPKKATTMKPVQIKLIQKHSGGSAPPSDWSSLKKSRKTFARAPVEIIKSKILKVPPPQPRSNKLCLAVGRSSKQAMKEEEKTKRNTVLTGLKKPLFALGEEVISYLDQPDTVRTIMKSTDHRMPEHIATKITEQETCIRLLKERADAAEEMAKIHRGRAEEIQQDAQKFLNCWSRAVKTLEIIRDSKIHLDERLKRAINNHCVALRSHETSSIYSSKFIELNSSRRSLESGYFSPNREADLSREIPPNRWESRGLDLGIRIARGDALAPNSEEPRLSEEPPVTNMSLDSFSGSSKSIFGESLLGLSSREM